MKKERKENVWRTSEIKERDIDNVFHEWEEDLQTHACRMNFVIDLAHRGVCGSVAEHQSAESGGLRFDSSLGLTIVFLCPTLVTRRNFINKLLLKIHLHYI